MIKGLDDAIESLQHFQILLGKTKWGAQVIDSKQWDAKIDKFCISTYWVFEFLIVAHSVIQYVATWLDYYLEKLNQMRNNFKYQPIND